MGVGGSAVVAYLLPPIAHRPSPAVHPPTAHLSKTFTAIGRLLLGRGRTFNSQSCTDRSPVFPPRPPRFAGWTPAGPKSLPSPLS